MTLGETQSGVDKHLETRVLDTGSIKDLRSMKDVSSMKRLSKVELNYYVCNITLPYSISGVTNSPR